MQGNAPSEEGQAVIAMQQMATVWEQLFPAEQHRILKLLITRVQFNDQGLDIVWADHGWRAFAQEVETQPWMQEMREDQEELA
jgi:site-specific DNA recombinase